MRVLAVLAAIALDVGRASVTACQVVRDRRTIVLRNWIAIEDPLRERPPGPRRAAIGPCAHPRERADLQQIDMRPTMLIRIWSSYHRVPLTLESLCT